MARHRRKVTQEEIHLYGKRKNKLVASLLALFLGLFGVHRFYLGQFALGAFFIFLFVLNTSGVFFPELPWVFFIAAIDSLRLFFMSKYEFDQKYNGGFSSKKEQRKARRNTAPQRTQSKAPVRSAAKLRNNPFKTSGKKKYEDFDVDGAINDFVEGLNISPKDQELHYLIAKAYSLNEDAQLSYHHLTQAMRNGFEHENLILEEDDFAFLRIDPGFEDFKNNGFKTVPKAFKKKKIKEDDDALLNQLNKLSELRKRGLLTENEFLIEKDKLMNR